MYANQIGKSDFVCRARIIFLAIGCKVFDVVF